MTDPQQFFQKAALWDVAPSPDASDTAAAATAAPVGGDNGGRNSTLVGIGQSDRSAVPDDAAAGRERSGVRARATVRAASARPTSSRRSSSRATTAANYGKLMLYQAPDQSNAVVTGACRVAHRGRSDRSARSSRCSTNSDRRSCAAPRSSFRSTTRSSTCSRSTSRARARSRCPRFNYVAVTYGEQAVLDTSVTDAVEQPARGHDALGRDVEHDRRTPTQTGSTTTTTTTPTTNTTPTSNTQPPANATVAQLLAEADQLSVQANQALANSDLATYRRGHQAGRRPSSPQATALAQSSPTTVPTTTTTPVALEHDPDHDRRQRPGSDPTTTRGPRLGPRSRRPRAGSRGLSAGPGIVTIWVVLIPGEAGPPPGPLAGSRPMVGTVVEEAKACGCPGHRSGQVQARLARHRAERLQAQEGPERGDRPRDLVAQVRARVDDEVPPQRAEALRAQADARLVREEHARPSTSTTSTTTSSRPRVRSTTGTCSRKR